MVAGFDTTAMVNGDLLHDGQSQATAAAIGAGTGGIPPIKALKHAREIGLTQARAMVTNAEQPPAAALTDGNVDAARLLVEEGVDVNKKDQYAWSVVLSNFW